MKLLFTLFIFSIGLTFSYGQSSQIPDIGSTWVEADFGMVSMSLPMVTEVESDTVIGDYSYKKIGPGYFRDSLNVWYTRAEGDTTDHLYYDFNVSLGDTVYPVNPFLDEIERAPYLVVTSVDSLQLLDGSWKKRIRLIYEHDETGGFAGNTWVEDIGTTRGILRNAHNVGIDGGYRGLVCFTNADGQVHYEDPVPEEYGFLEYTYENCYWTVGISEIVSSDLKLTPNPANQLVKLEFEKGSNELGKLMIINLQGQVLKQVQLTGKRVLEISVDDIPNGIYLLQLKGEGISHSQRLVIQH